MISQMLPFEEQRFQLVDDIELPKYLLLSYPFLNEFLITEVLDIVLEVSNAKEAKIKSMYFKLSEIMHF